MERRYAVRSLRKCASLKEARHSIECNTLIIAHLTFICKCCLCFTYRTDLQTYVHQAAAAVVAEHFA